LQAKQNIGVNSSDTTVLIVGAGPVGLSAAFALSKMNIDVQVIDSGLDVDSRMRASTFHPPTLDMIEELGVLDELLAEGLKVPVWRMRQHESGESVAFDLGLLGDATSHPYRLQIEQHRYCSLLVNALAKRGVVVEFGVQAVDAQQDDSGVTLTLDGLDRRRADWLIGADGASSQIRKSQNLDYGGKTYTHSSVLLATPFQFDQYLEDVSGVTYCWSGRGPFSLLGLKSLWRASLYPGVKDLSSAAEEERVREWLEFIHPAAADAEISDVNPYKVHERCVDTFRVGRVLLAGDAAHLNPPNGGMGMNGGIHDAMSLTKALQSVLAGEDEALLDRYSRQRRYVISQRLIPQASANRARMATLDIELQLERLAEQRRLADDPKRCRDFLLKSSMISGLREAEAIE